MSQNKIPEIVILSECSKEYKVGFELYKAYTGDTNFESPRDIHPTKNMTIGGKEYKIHFFAIQDSYWPAISNICRYCDGAVFAIDIEDYTEEGGVEFIKEWLINLDDLDKDDMKIVIVGISKTEQSRNNNGREDLVKLASEKNIELYFLNINNKDKNKIEEPFKKVADLINNVADNPAKKEDEEMEEYLDKYKNF